MLSRQHATHQQHKPSGFWADKKNQQEFLATLAKKLSIHICISEDKLIWYTSSGWRIGIMSPHEMHCHMEQEDCCGITEALSCVHFAVCIQSTSGPTTVTSLHTSGSHGKEKCPNHNVSLTHDPRLTSDTIHATIEQLFPIANRFINYRHPDMPDKLEYDVLDEDRNYYLITIGLPS